MNATRVEVTNGKVLYKGESLAVWASRVAERIVDRCGASRVILYGSVARGEETVTSDIDFLVEFEPGSSLFDLLHISEELEALLGVPVDVVSAGGLKDRDDHIRRPSRLWVRRASDRVLKRCRPRV